MDELIPRITELLETHRVWAGPIMGALALGESLALVGLFVPATALMLVIGGLIGGGLLDPLPIFLWSVAGSVAGDSLSYALGRWIGPRVYYRWPLRNHRAMVARARLFFRKYGFWSILSGRFFGPVRSTIPLIGGVMQMPQKPFQLANLLSAVLWVPVMLAPGVLAARGVGGLEGLEGPHWSILAILIVLFCVVGPLLAARLFKARIERDHRRRAAERRRA